ncbi:PDGLE domain protein [anaerobic digester metagenome]
MISNRSFLALGLVLALIVGVAAVFLASGDPDGLDSTALVVQGQKELTQPANPDAEVDESALPGEFEYSAPFPDYTIEGATKMTDTVLVVVGTLIAVLLVFALGKSLKVFSRTRSS